MIDKDGRRVGMTKPSKQSLAFWAEAKGLVDQIKGIAEKHGVPARKALGRLQYIDIALHGTKRMRRA